MITRLAVLLIILATCISLGATASRASASSDPTALRQTLSLLDSQVAAAATKSSPDDPIYFDDGVWMNSTTTCWSCSNGGLATAAATLWRGTGRTRSDLLEKAVQTIDTAIATRQGPDGSFSPPPGTADGQPPGIATMFFGVEMGTTLMVLSPALDAARHMRWVESLARAADYVINSGNTTWYANGNINLGYVELVYFAWRTTGAARFQQAYETAWSFLINPPQDKFPGDGLRIVRQPSSPDGSDGAGYLAENGAGGVGFDAEYSQLQLDAACRLYLVSGDARFLRLANLLVNMLMPRVGPDWQLDTSGGTRHTEANRKVPFLSSALAVLGWRAGRTDLAGRVSSHLAATTMQYAAPWNQGNDVFRRALGDDISVIALAAGLDAPPPTGGAASAPAPPATACSRCTARTKHRAKRRPALTVSGSRKGTHRALVTLRVRIRKAVRGHRRRVRVQWRRRHRWQTVKTTTATARRFKCVVRLPRSVAHHSVSLRVVVHGVGTSATLRLPR